jgi:hypothetical protein
MYVSDKCEAYIFRVTYPKYWGRTFHPVPEHVALNPHEQYSLTLTMLPSSYKILHKLFKFLLQKIYFEVWRRKDLAPQ